MACRWQARAAPDQGSFVLCTSEQAFLRFPQEIAAPISAAKQKRQGAAAQRLRRQAPFTRTLCVRPRQISNPHTKTVAFYGNFSYFGHFWC